MSWYKVSNTEGDVTLVYPTNRLAGCFDVVFNKAAQAADYDIFGEFSVEPIFPGMAVQQFLWKHTVNGVLGDSKVIHLLNLLEAWVEAEVDYLINNDLLEIDTHTGEWVRTDTGARSYNTFDLI